MSRNNKRTWPPYKVPSGHMGPRADMAGQGGPEHRADWGTGVGDEERSMLGGEPLAGLLLLGR